jgi:hypothetical protein
MNRDDYVYKYNEVCDVVERNYHEWPLADDDDDLLHTSDQARAAANRIFKILGVELDFDGETTIGDCASCGTIGAAVGTDPASGAQLCQDCWVLMSLLGSSMEERRRHLVGLAQYRLDHLPHGGGSDDQVASSLDVLRRFGDGDEPA